jgi:hypothetical protein
MQIHQIPNLGVVAFALRDLYRRDEAPMGLDYQRRLAVWRLGRVLEDQLGVGPDEAYCMAAAILAPAASA